MSRIDLYRIALNIIKSNVFITNKYSIISSSSKLTYLRYNHLNNQIRLYYNVTNRNKSTFNQPEPVPQLFGNDSDTFGLLSGDPSFLDDLPEDPGDIQEEEFISSPPSHSRQLTTAQYADIIKNHLKYKRLKEAMDVLRVKMLKEDRVKPENYIYNLLISGCAAEGYTKMAFKLFNEMKNRDLNVTGGTYTSLFNSCANSPWPKDGLIRASHLRQLMKQKMIEPNLTNYNSMIKAFGRCGDVITAFKIVDEMYEKKIPIRSHTYNFLLQACISDKENGFKYALITWRKMLKKREKPNIYSFNLMLKCAKECGAGEDISDLTKMLTDSTSPSKLLDSEIYENRRKEDEILKIKEKATSSDLTENQTIQPQSSALPNLISLIPSSDGFISLKPPSSAEERFCMIGGLEGFLREVNKYKIKPDIKMMTQILHLIPGNLESENALLSLIDKLNMKYDIDFFNMLIKKRCLRLDYESALEVKTLIEKVDKRERKKRFWKNRAVLKPDIITYGVLALTCNTKQKAEEFLNEMTSRKLRINAEIIGTLLKNATFRNDFEYVDFIIKTVKKEDIYVNKIYLDELSKFKAKCKDLSKNPKTKDYIKSKSQKFLHISGGIEQKMENLKENEPEYPWAQFKENIVPSFQRDPNFLPKTRYYLQRRRRVPRYVVKM